MESSSESSSVSELEIEVETSDDTETSREDARYSNSETDIICKLAIYHQAHILLMLTNQPSQS